MITTRLPTELRSTGSEGVRSAMSGKGLPLLGGSGRGRRSPRSTLRDGRQQRTRTEREHSQQDDHVGGSRVGDASEAEYGQDDQGRGGDPQKSGLVGDDDVPF